MIGKICFYHTSLTTCFWISAVSLQFIGKFAPLRELIALIFLENFIRNIEDHLEPGLFHALMTHTYKSSIVSFYSNRITHEFIGSGVMTINFGHSPFGKSSSSTNIRYFNEFNSRSFLRLTFQQLGNTSEKVFVRVAINHSCGFQVGQN